MSRAWGQQRSFVRTYRCPNLSRSRHKVAANGSNSISPYTSVVEVYDLLSRSPRDAILPANRGKLDHSSRYSRPASATSIGAVRSVSCDASSRPPYASASSAAREAVSAMAVGWAGR